MGAAVLETDDKRSLAHESEPVSQFVEEKCKLDPRAKIIKANLYRCYREWCAENVVTPLSKHKFGRKLLHLHPDQVTADGKATENGQRHDCYTGITLSEVETQQ